MRATHFRVWLAFQFGMALCGPGAATAQVPLDANEIVVTAMNPDVETVTARYIDSAGAERLVQAAQYAEGTHWLLLWGVLFSVFVTWLIVRSGVLDRLQAKLQGRHLATQAFIVSATYIAVSSVLTFPLSIYESWWRERFYEFSEQTLGDFLLQTAIEDVLGVVAGGLFLCLLYLLIRAAGRRWWLWSGALAAGFLSLSLLASPVLIEPIFNSYEPVPEGPVRQALTAMAERAGIPADRIFMYDGSSQSNLFAANVSGIGPSVRIAISDTALQQATLDEVKAVTGHEIGHYVLGHIWHAVLFYTFLAFAMFYLADRLFPRIARIFGTDAQLGEPRGLPVLALSASALMLLATPITHLMSRASESEADTFSLQTVREPDGLASALVKAIGPRDPRPHRVEEILFYSHPSIQRRVRRAMQWKADHAKQAR